jgi:DNA repair protein RadC
LGFLARAFCVLAYILFVIIFLPESICCMKIPIYKCVLVKERKTINIPDRNMENFDAVSRAMHSLTSRLPVEQFWCFYVNGKNELTGAEMIAQGGMHGAAVTAREILRGGIIHGASAIILGHNHPSGDPTPSREDIEITEVLLHAASIIHLPILDHVVVGGGRAASVMNYITVNSVAA